MFAFQSGFLGPLSVAGAVLGRFGVCDRIGKASATSFKKLLKLSFGMQKLGIRIVLTP